MILIPTYDSSAKTIVWMKYCHNTIQLSNPDISRNITLRVSSTTISKFDEWLASNYWLKRRPR